MLLFQGAFFNRVLATHSAGSDIKYRCLGGLHYEIEVTFYRDCGGVAEPAMITVNCRSASGGHNLNISLTKLIGGNNGEEITVPCSTSTTSCNFGAGTGVRKWVYRGVVTLPSQRADWVFSYAICCRNCTITTISNPCAGGSNLYVEATLNNIVAPCNSSPTFSNAPIAFVCIGQNFSYNHGVLDPDGDSLAYSLITPKTSATGTVNFIPPASVNTPIASSTPFTIHPVTGDLNFTPSQNQIGIMAILVREFRNGVQIGSCIRDMQVYTQPCTNNLPTITGINGTTNFTMTACAGQPICFTVNTVDPDASQQVTMTTNNGITGATYSISNSSRPTLTFCWTPTVEDINLLPNTFTITVRDDACPNNGIQTFSFSIFVPTPFFTVSGTNVLCSGGSSGAATAAPVFSATYNYLWNTGATSATLSGLTAGTYTVTATDPTSGCSATQSVAVYQPSGLSLNNALVNPTCSGNNNGSIDLSITGGAAPYTYTWNTGATTQDLTNMSAGTYTVTVTDANGCSGVSTTTLQYSNNITAITTPSHIRCYGQANGSIAVSVANGTVPYQFIWSNGQTSATGSNLSAGTYTVTVADANGCKASATATITQPASPLTGSVVNTSTTCSGSPGGALSATVSGGAVPYTYLWSNNATSSTISGLTAGTYTVTVTDSRGCTLSMVRTVNQPPTPLQATPATTAISCFGLANGTVSLNVSGGSAPYTYSWSNGASTPALNGVAAGNYTATVTDANGCTTTTNATVTQPAVLSVQPTPTAVSCRGGQTGAISLAVSGGTTPYFYHWSNGSVTQGISNVPAGTYTVTVTDSRNCTATTGAVAITQPAAALSAPATRTHLQCNGLATGTIALNPSGGTAPYTYSWSNGATTPAINGLPAGTYTVTVTDAANCRETRTHLLLQPATALTVTLSKTDTRCDNTASGIATAIAAGGTSPYTYSWSSGATTASISGLNAGSYTVTVTDANGCTKAGTITLLQSSGTLSVNATVTPASCYSTATGSISVSGTGGTAPYTFQWNNGNAAPTLLQLAAGAYTVTVSDANQCSAIATYTVSQPAAVLSATITNASTRCYQQNSGTATATATGGTMPYGYSWNTGAATGTINNLAAGNYTVTVTDANGCTFSKSTYITAPATPVTVTLKSNNISCNGGTNGSIISTPAGGTPPYIYSWSNGASTQGIFSLGTGTYSITVTDQNGCSASGSAKLTQPAKPMVLSTTATHINCASKTVGSINLTVSGGPAPYTYLWSNGSVQEDITNLTAGNYTVTVTDANGCSAQTTRTVLQPGGAMQLVSTINNIPCFGGNTGSIDLTLSAGTPPYTYAWSTGSTTRDITGLTAGAYTVTVTDNNSCELINTLWITQPLRELAASTLPTPVACHGEATGAVGLYVDGGTTPYNYAWSNAAVSKDISGLVQGTYTVTVTDLNGCTTTVQQIINQPTAPLTVSAATTLPHCAGTAAGAITLTANGGTGTYTYQWDHGATTAALTSLTADTYTVTVTDQQGCIEREQITLPYSTTVLTADIQSSPALCHAASTGNALLNLHGGTAPFQYNWTNGSTTQHLNNIPAGSYAVTITDANGCTTTATTSIGEPVTDLSSTAATVHVNCFGAQTGEVNIGVNGGTYPYSYAWSNGATTEDICSLAAGTYTVLITDVNGCTTTQTITIQEPAAIINTITNVTPVNCQGDASGSITTTTTGGTAPYTYEWNNQPGTSDLTGITAGDYCLLVTDADGCYTQQTITVNEPTESLTTVAGVTNIDCKGNSTGQATVQVSGGTAPYHCAWSNGATQLQTSGLSSGIYTYTITDDHGCTFTNTATITEPTTTLSISGTVQDANCHGVATGSIDLTISGGTAAYIYNWSNGSTHEDLYQLGAGTYTISITDLNNCTAVQTFSIQEPVAPLQIQETILPVRCHGGQDASINLQVNGGTGPFTFNWSNGATGNQLPSASAGNYTVIVTDYNGCTRTETFTVTEPSDAIHGMLTVHAVSCHGETNGAVTLATNGGTAPYNFQWSNGATSKDISQLATGIYTVTITDANNCHLTESRYVYEPSSMMQISRSIQHVQCHADSSGIVNITVNGGTAPYVYQWNTGETTSALNRLTAGHYTVTVTDANGCSTTDNLTLTEPDSSMNISMSIGHISCHAQASGWIDLTVSGGTGPYSYNWNNGTATEDPQQLQAGIYTVVVTDQQGCTRQLSGQVTQPALFPRVSAVTTPVSCQGLSNGGVNVAVYDGSPPYSYSWNTGATMPMLTNQPSGIYEVTVTDANGCSAQHTTLISEPDQLLSAGSAVSDANCITGQLGSIQVLPAGGTGTYTYMWNTGATTGTLENGQPGTYIVTVTDANGCEVTQSYVIEDKSILSITVNDAEICMGEMARIGCDSVPDATYQWYYNGIMLNGANTPHFITPVAGTYLLSVTTPCGNYTSNPIEITVKTLSNVSISNNVIICAGENTQLIAGGGKEYLWTPASGLSNPDISNPIASPATTTIYTVVIKDNYGCTASATVTVTVLCDTLDIPNGFSPNGDGTNDVFEIEGIDKFPGNVLFIYNRWGNLVYKKKEYANEWDGRSNVNGVMFGEELPNGTYYYILDLNKEQKPVNGFVVLKR